MKYNRQYVRLRKKRGFGFYSKLVFIFIVLAIIIVGLTLWWLPVPALIATTQNLNVQTTSSKLPWPNYGEASIGAKDYGLLSSSGAQTPRPTASVAKLITAILVLQKHPLTIGQQGPLLTLTNDDIVSYQHYINQNGSVVNVAVGEQISEYQALEAMLLPSANNMADTLAIWAYGSLTNYQVAANQFLAAKGLLHTTIGSDASGFSPSTSSTSDDLVKLGLFSLDNPVLNQIVGLANATIPVAGQINNVNYLLNQYGITGLKTGNTNEAGGVFLFSANGKTANNKNVKVIGAIMGAPTLQVAMKDTVPLLQASEKNFHDQTIIQAGQVVGQFHVPWSQDINITANKDITVSTWGGATFEPTIALGNIYAPLTTANPVGNVNVQIYGNNYSSPLLLQSQLIKPSIKYRLTRGRLPNFSHQIFNR